MTDFRSKCGIFNVPGSSLALFGLDPVGDVLLKRRGSRRSVVFCRSRNLILGSPFVPWLRSRKRAVCMQCSSRDLCFCGSEVVKVVEVWCGEEPMAR